MSLNQVSRSPFHSIKKLDNQLQFKPGQIIQGKILKLFPNNKAQIQLGSQQMVAQLEAALTVGKNYLLQVQEVSDFIKLKVVNHGDGINYSKDGVIALLRYLGLHFSKQSLLFTESLIDLKIPFHKEQLEKAIHLLEVTKNKEQAQQVLKYMITRNYPIKDSVFYGLLARNTDYFTNQIKSFLEQVHSHHHPLTRDISEQLKAINEPPLKEKASTIRAIINDLHENKGRFFYMLKASGILHHSVNFSMWKSAWEQVVKQYNLHGNNSRNEFISDIKMPFSLNQVTMIPRLEQLVNNRLQIEKTVHELLKAWKPLFSQQTVNRDFMLASISDALKQRATKLFPFLLEQGPPVKSQEMINILQTFVLPESYKRLSQFLQRVKLDYLMQISSPRDQLLQQVNQVLHSVGLSYENQLANEQSQTKTVKAMLLQLLQHADDMNGQTQKPFQQLLHYINGMQLQSVNETNQIIQAHLQIPGERLGLKNDFKLEFQGKKTKEGKIDSDHCRILFYLELAHLNQTIIDMHVQRRNVSLTIYNDETNIKNKAIQFEPLLGKGLASLNYRLSSIIFKPVASLKKSKSQSQRRQDPVLYEGVDFRI